MIGRARERLASGDVMFGGYVQTASPELVEIIGDAGFDFVILSAEDTPYDLAQRQRQFYAAELAGLATIYRPPSIDPVAIRRALDAGAAGLNIPSVESAEDAVLAVRATRFPPRGDRGLNAMSRATRYGADFGPAYFDGAPDPVVTVLIESARAVDRIADIVAVDGVDVAYLGPTDLSISLGVPGDVFHPDVTEAAARVRAAARDAGVAAGTVVYRPGESDEIERRLDEGYAMLSLFLDVALFRQNCRAMLDRACAARAVLGRTTGTASGDRP